MRAPAGHAENVAFDTSNPAEILYLIDHNIRVGGNAPFKNERFRTMARELSDAEQALCQPTVEIR